MQRMVAKGRVPSEQAGESVCISPLRFLTRFRGLENKASRALGSGQNGHAGRTWAGHEWDDGEPQVAREVPEPLLWRPDFRQDASCLSRREWALHVLALLHEHIIHK